MKTKAIVRNYKVGDRIYILLEVGYRVYVTLTKDEVSTEVTVETDGHMKGSLDIVSDDVTVVLEEDQQEVAGIIEENLGWAVEIKGGTL